MKIEFAQALNASLPQTSITMQTMIHGSSELQSCAWVSGVLSSGVTGFIVATDSSLPRSTGDSHSTLGCQTLRKRMRQPIEIKEAPISTIQGLIKFEMTNCGTANEIPVTRVAGQTSFMPFQPANAHTTQNGTISEKIGNCLPTMAPNRNGSIPVTVARPWIGGTERAEGDRRGIGDQRQAGGGERRETETDQDRAGHRDRRTEARRAFKERAE